MSSALNEHLKLKWAYFHNWIIQFRLLVSFGYLASY